MEVSVKLKISQSCFYTAICVLALQSPNWPQVLITQVAYTHKANANRVRNKEMEINL